MGKLAISGRSARKKEAWAEQQTNKIEKLPAPPTQHRIRSGSTSDGLEALDLSDRS